MSHPAPIPPPRDRKARRKLSPGQVAYLERKAVRDKAKAERKAKYRLDAWYLKEFHPEIAKARREKGIKNNAKAAAWRRQYFVESFSDWPSVIAPGDERGEMAYRIREWLRDPSRSFVTKSGRRRWKWRGCEKHFVKTEASVRKKLTDLGVFRYNFRLRLWFKCGSVEEAEETNQQREQEALRRRLAHEEAERDRRERSDAECKKRQEAERLKAEAEQAERDRLNSPAISGWHDFIPEGLKPIALDWLAESWLARCSPVQAEKPQSLDDAKARDVELVLRKKDRFVRYLQIEADRKKLQEAERMA